VVVDIKGIFCRFEGIILRWRRFYFLHGNELKDMGENEESKIKERRGKTGKMGMSVVCEIN
jgi:hypothetical protein